MTTRVPAASGCPVRYHAYMARVEPQHDRETVNRAGALLLRFHRGEALQSTEWEKAVDIVNNWRSAHAYPLNAIQMNLRNAAKRSDRHALLAQRIKRLSSIALKLDRFEKMRLSQMQDLGGCRGILEGVAEVRELANFYQHDTRQRHELATTDDYISSPKSSGYRGVHFVFKYRSDNRWNSDFNGLKIEMQLRSRYQHAWATAVETVGTFSGEALKSSLGSQEWQRFFSLMGSVVAMREKMPLVPDTPTLRRALTEELATYANDLNVVERLRGYRSALRAMQAPTQTDASYFLLRLDPEAGTLSVRGYRSDKIAEASAQYALFEEDAAKKARGVDAVLVSVESVNNLGRAYPNYFADTRVFLQLLRQALSGHSRGIVVPNVEIAHAGAADPSEFPIVEPSPPPISTPTEPPAPRGGNGAPKR